MLYNATCWVEPLIRSSKMEAELYSCVVYMYIF